MIGRGRRNRRRGNRFDDGEDINPLTYTANISDAMLILAVGIMLALIVHWNVDVSTTGGDMSGEETPMVQGNDEIDTNSAISFEEQDMEQLDSSENMEEGDGMDKLGEVYYDAATGKYYIIENDRQEEGQSEDDAEISSEIQEGMGE